MHNFVNNLIRFQCIRGPCCLHIIKDTCLTVNHFQSNEMVIDRICDIHCHAPLILVNYTFLKWNSYTYVLFITAVFVCAYHLLASPSAKLNVLKDILLAYYFFYQVTAKLLSSRLIQNLQFYNIISHAVLLILFNGLTSIWRVSKLPMDDI